MNSIGTGSIVGGYRIERVLGEGGMGTVFLAKHPILPRRDAIKVLSKQYSADPEFRARFEREANLAAALDHPNVVAVYNRGEENGQLWIAMQYVDGIDAAAAMVLEPQSMTPQRALRIVTEVGRGLDHAHRRGLLHRDIKPANFLLAAVDGEEERVLLTDFGVAKSTDDTLELTQSGAFVATIAYASPEQLSGERVDHRTDIYSLACAFFKLAAGQNPYPSTQPTKVMIGHLHEPPPRISEVNFALPTAVDEVLAVAMAKNPAERFDTCHEFTSALRDALTRGVSTISAPTQPDSVRPGAVGWKPQAAPHGTQSIPFGPPTAPLAGPDSTGGNALQPNGFAGPAAPGRAASGARRGFGRGRLIVAAVGLVVSVAVAGTVWLTSGGDTGSAAPPPGTSVPATSTAGVALTIAEARRANPAFLGKTIVAVDVSGDSNAPMLGVHLKPGPQSQFLESLGFIYHPEFGRQGDEASPRVFPSAPYDPATLSAVSSGYLLAVRSDSSAGSGGLRDLPFAILGRHATVLVLDDPAAVRALREWTDDSERLLLDKLLPVLAKGIK